MKSEATRAYRQTARAEAAARTRENIMQAAADLWSDWEFDEVTLAEIAERAGVTAQTVLRRFGSKEGLLDACLAERSSAVEELRAQAPVGDPDGAVDILLMHYETDGDRVVKLLEREARSELVRRVTTHGRKAHRQWCARVFAPYLDDPRAKPYRVHLDSFVAATDVYLWKLLRRDLGRSLEETRRALVHLVHGLTSPATKDQRR